MPDFVSQRFVYLHLPAYPSAFAAIAIGYAETC